MRRGLLSGRALAGGERGDSRGRVQRAAARLYAALGARGLLVGVIAAGIANVAVTVLLILGGLARFINTPLHEYVRAAAVAELLAGAATAAGLLAAREPLRTVWSWVGNERTPAAAAAVWRATITLPRRVVLVTAPACMILELAVLALVLSDQHQTAWLAIPAAVALAGGVVANAVFTMLGAELALRPIVEDAAQFLPVDFDPDVSTLLVRTKVLAPVPGAVMFASLLASSVATTHTGYLARAMATMVAGVSVVAISYGLFFVSTGAALDPIDELTRATERVQHGDLDTPVSVLTGDEFGALGRNFNEMLAGLREREALHEELRASRARIVTAADGARRQVERDLHDGAQQQLVLLSLRLSAAERLIATDPSAARELHAELRADAARALTQLRDLAHGIYPEALARGGLPAALGDAAARAPIRTTLDCDGAGRFRPELEAAVYFCCVEALQNAAKHGGPGATARIVLRRDGTALRVTVQDTGRGFDPATVRRNAGTMNMIDRLGALGGELRITSAPGRGTIVSATIPT